MSTTIQLSHDEYLALRATIHAVNDAVRESEIAAARAKVAIGEAVAKQTSLVRGLAVAHPELDPDQGFRLGPDCTLIQGEP